MPFKVDAASGQVTVHSDLDYERRPRSYHLYLRASDYGRPLQRHGFTTLVVAVVDVNDSPPRFRRRRCSVRLSRRSARKGSVVAEAGAIDADADARLVYSSAPSVNNDTRGCLRVDVDDGDVTLQCTPASFLDVYGWTFGVVATDGVHTTDVNTVSGGESRRE